MRYFILKAKLCILQNSLSNIPLFYHKKTYIPDSFNEKKLFKDTTSLERILSY